MLSIEKKNACNCTGFLNGCFAQIIFSQILIHDDDDIFLRNG